jgi:hypothetical protein
MATKTTTRCALKAGHMGAHLWIKTTSTMVLVSDCVSRVTPSEPPCIQHLIDHREADVRSGQLVKRMGAR